MKSQLILFRLLLLSCLYVCITCRVSQSARANDLARKLEQVASGMTDDIEFGLGTYAAHSSLFVETSADSDLWVEGTAKLFNFVADDLDFQRSEWKLSIIDDQRMEPNIDLAYFRGRECEISKLQLNKSLYLNMLGSDQWLKTDSHKGFCITFLPTTWPIIYPQAFSRSADGPSSHFLSFYRKSFCISAEQVDSRTIDSVWTDKSKTPDGQRFAFNVIKFKDELPVSFATYAYRTGFRELDSLPKIKDCRRVNLIETTWVKFNDVHMPKRVVGDLEGATGFNQIKFKVDIEYFGEKSKEYKAIEKTIADAKREIEESERAKKPKKPK